jgi:site-specific DNA-cytosine methylase
MFDEQDRQYFYNEFKNNGYEVGSYDDFKKDLNNEEDRNWYYNEAKNMGYDVGTQADFDKMVLEPAPSTSGGGKQVDASATTQSVEQKASSETKPQVAQPAKKQETTDKVPGLIAKVLDMIPTGVQMSNGTYQPSPEIPQPVVKGEEMPVKEETSSSSSANAASPESKEAAPVTTPTGVVNNEGLMDAKLANYIEDWKQRPDKQSTYFENLVADLLADGTANSNEEAVNMVMPALHRYANRSAMDVTNQVVSSLPDDTVQDAEKSIETQWYSHGVQDKLKQEAYNMGISYDDYVGLFLKPAMVQSLVNKYGPKYRDIAEGIATRLYSHDENVQDRLMNQDINDALSSVISKYVNPSVVDEYNKAQEAGSKAFTEGMEGSQFIPANLRLGTALGAQYEANEAKDPAKVLSGLQQKFGKLYRNPKFLNDMSNAAFKVMQRYGLNGTQSSDPKRFKPMINSVLKNELDQLEIKGMMPKGSAEYIMKTGLGNTIVGKITRKAVQTDYQNWLEDIANQQYHPGFWENVASGALTFAGDAWSYWLPGAAGGKLTKSMIAKAEGKLAGDLMAKGMERKMAERAAKVLIGKSKAAALKSGAVHGAVTFGGQSAISKPIDEVYRTGQFDENGKIYNPSGWKIALDTLLEGTQQSALGVIMQGNTIANMLGKGRGLATNILADVGGKVADSGIMTGHQMLERMAQDPNFKPTGKDAAESFLESMANLTAIGLPGMVGKYARFKDAREFNKKFDFSDQDIAELKRFGYDGLRDAFEKVGIGEYAVVGENAQRLDGQLTQKYMDLMNDKSVPEVLKAKMMAVVEGKRPSSFSPVVDSIIVQPMDNDGKVYLETLNKNGGIVERKEFASLDEAQKADKKLEYEKTLGLASVLEGEFHNEFTQEHLDGLYNKAAQKYNMGEKLTDEDKAAVYLHQNAGAIKEIMDKQQKGIILTDEEQKQVNAYRHYYDSALENSSVMREFVNTFEDSHGVARGTLRKALESKDKKYAPLVESYLKELYNSIELKREMKQIEDDRKRLEQGNVDGEKPATPVEGPASVEGSAGGQEPPVSEEPAPYQDRTNSVPTPSDAEVAASPANSAAEGAVNEPKVASSDAFVMGQNAYKNGDSEALQAIDYNSDLATGRLKRAFADNEKMPDIVANAYSEGKDMDLFVAQRAGSLTPAQKDAISKYVEAMDAKKGAIDALQHADDGYGDALKEQLWPYQTEDGNIVPATLDSGKQVFLKKANEYGGAFVVVPDEQGQPTIKQVSNAEIKEVGTPVSLDDYIENAVAQQKDARAQQFISQFDGSGLKPNDQVTVAMEEGDANINMTFAGYSKDGKIVLTDGKDYLPLSKEEFAAWRKNALDNTINEHLDAEDDEREQKAASQAEADKKQRYANGIVGLSEGQPDYSSNDTDPNVAAEYLQEQFGEDHGKLLNLVNGSRDDIKTQLANKRKAAIEYQNWLDTNADLDPEKAKKVEDELSLVNEQIADLDARFKNWNTIRNSVMTPDEVKAMKEERKAEVEKAGVDESAIVPSDDFHVLVLEDEELKKQYPTMDKATDYITSQRKDLYHTQEDVERKINGVNDMLDQYINGETELEPTQLMELNTTKAQLEALQTNLSVAAKGLKAQANKLSKLYKTEVSQQEMEKLGMTPSEQRKALVTDALKKNDMKAIHEIYKDASVDVMDLTPQTLEEAVSESLLPHSLNPESLQYELGKSNFKFGIGKRYDSNKFNYLIAKKGTGMSVNEFAVRVYNDLPVNLQDMGYSDQDVRNTLLDMFKSYDSVKEMRNVALMNRIAAAEDELSSEEEYYEAQKEREIIERQAEIENYKSYIHEKELSLPSESELDHINGLEFERMMEIEDREREYKQYVKSILPELADYDDRSNEEGYGGGSSLGSDSSRRGVDEGNSQGEEVGNGEASSESEIGEGSDSGRKGRQETGSMEPGEGSAVRGSHLPQEASFGERLKSAIAETETEPTEAQKKAGNYKKGHLSFGGYDYTVETPKGVTRSGKDEQGKPWSVTMHDTYGYILGKIGVDGDHIDMFINDAADLDTFDGNVYVVDQVNPETGEFDEHKVMYGYPSEEAATEAYLANYSKGWKGLGKVTSVPKATFDKWLESSDRKTKPFAEYAMVQKEQAKFDRGVKEVKPSEMTEAQKVAYDAVSTMLKKAGIPVKVVSNEDMEKVAEAQDNMAVEMLLNDPRLRFYIKTPEQKEAAKAAYDWAAKNRPDKFKQYAIVNMDNPNQPPQYFEKKDLAEKWRKYYTNAWKIGNYKAFNLNKPFEEQIKDVKGDVPSEFDPYKAESLFNKRIELERQIKETEDSYNAKKKERAEYQNQLMQDYMDQHGLSSENDIPDDVWTDYRDKSFEKYQDTLDDLFHKYVELDNQLKAVAEPGVRFLRTYHGSGANFSEFDFDHMSEGAGSQVFGWGGYVTSSKKIGKDYASIKYDPDKDVEYVGKNKKTFTDLIATLFDGGIRDYNYVKNTLLEISDNDKSNISKKEEYDWFVSTKPEDWFNPNPTTNRNLYEVNIPEDNGSNYLEWEKTLTEKQINAIRDALAKNGVDISSFEKRGFKLDLPFKYVYTTVLPMMMHSKPKDVSKFLSSLGFTGIKYPAGTIMGGAEEGDTNYVIFKPEDMKIVDHTKFAQGKGVVYGYTDGKQIVLNQEHLNPNTPIHEYQHLWRTAAKNMNPELIEHGDKLIMQTQLFADLKQDPNYNHLTDEQICDEAFARLTGEDGAAILEQMAKDAIKENPLDTAKELSVINKLKEWLKKFWYWTLDTFTKWKPEDIKKMTLEDIRNLVLRDLANGVDPRTKFHEAENADDIKFMGSTTKKRMKDISTQLEGRELDEAQQAVADVYSGKMDNVSLTVEREDGSNKIIMRQGNDNHAGTKHSVFRHYGVKANSLNVDDLLLIPTVLKEGERKVSDNGRVAYVYVDPTSQVKYTVVTEPKNNKEYFNDFYSNKKANPSETSRVVENSTNTPEGAHNNDGNAFTAAKVDNNSETTKGNDGNLSVEDKIKAVSQQFGVDEADVAMYANAIKKGSTAEAARARVNIKRHLLQANEDKISSFKELLKYTVPVNEALKENFGDVDAMIEERKQQMEAQRNAMEAARKRAEEEEAKRQKHLEELSLIPDDQLDKQYMDALAKGDDATAREMLDEAARRRGYDDTESAYQGVGAWAAPGNPGYESDKARRDDWESSGSDVNLEDIALGYTPQPDDYFSHPERYSQNTPHGLESVKAINTAIDAIKNGEKDVKVKVYRAVPTSVKEGKLRNGDWVTPSKKYADMHGANRLEGKYRIIEDEVPATQLWWDGNDANEFGFDDGKAYKYKNAKNNRKLNDLVTYDDNGDVIPPSKRFNSRKQDVRFMFGGEKGAAEADKAEEKTYRMDNLKVAEKMERGKMDAKAIKLATGWERGADGKWRYEMPDAKIKDMKDIGGGNIVKRFDDDMLWNDGNLADVIDAPKLFEAYPQLKNVRIDTDAIMNDMPSNGNYNAKTNTITIHADELKYMNSILNHEIQHAIQYIEGFGKGGSPEQMEKEFKEAQDEWKARAYAHELEEKAKEMGGEYNQSEVEKALVEEYKDLDMSDELPDKETRIKGFNYFARGYADRSMDDTIKRFRLNESTRSDFDSYKEYLKLAGEVESRNVEKRLGMNDEERRNSLAEETEDVPRDSQIVSGNARASYKIVEQKLKKHPDSLMKAGTYFSGGGLVEEGLKGIIDPVVAVEYDRKISGVYRNNFGQHIVTADVRDVDPKELVKHIDGEVEYFHASPVCKNYSQAKSNSGEVELDKETAKSTADFIDAVKPRVVTIENVKGYKDSEAMKIITKALDKNGYTWDSDVYNAADYGGYTSRERLIVRAVKDGELPEKPKKQPRKGGWLEAVEDILPTLTVKESGVAPWMDARLKVDGIDWKKVEKPLYVMGSAYADGKIPHAYGDEILPTLRTKSGDVIIMPGGKVLRADGRVLARISGLGDDYKLPKTESLAHTIIGNGIPVQLTQGVIAPLLNKDDLSGRNVLARLGSSIFKNNWDADKQKQVSDRVVNTANKLGGAEATVYTSVDEVPDAYLSDVKNGATGWYDPTTHTVHVYLPNCADANEAERTVLHEKIGHEGMEVLLGGEDGVRKFANFVYRSVGKDVRGKIIDFANKYDPDWKNPDRMNVGTQEYIAHLAEESPKTAEDFSLWTKIKHYLIKLLKKLGVRVPGLLNDKDLRYYLMKAGKALHVWDEMPQEKQEAMMKQASNAEIKDALSDGAGKGKPRQKKGESTIQYMKRVQEWRKWQNAREDKENPEPPMFYDIDKDKAGKKEWAQLNKDWRERHHLVGEEPTGMPIRMENEEDDAYMNRIHEYEKWQAAMKDQEDPLPDMFAFEKKKQEEVKRKYEDWLAKHDLLEQQQADLDLYEGKIYPAETNPKADALEQQVMQDLAEVTSTDVSKEGAAMTVKHAVIHRRKNMEEASADDAIYINDVKNRIEKMADSGVFDKLLSDYKGKKNRAEKLAETIPYIIEAPRRLRDMAHNLNATGVFDKGHIHIQPADVEAIQPYVTGLITETAKKHTEIKKGKEIEVYDDPKAVSEVASKMAQAINANHQGEEGFVPCDGTDILSKHVLKLVKERVVPGRINYKELSPEMQAAIDSIRDWYNYTYDWLMDNHTLKAGTGYNVDYVNHIWDKEKSDPEAYATFVENRQRTKSPNEKPRTISTLMEGIYAGLVPKTTDITKMMAYYSRSNIEAWANKTLLQELTGLNVIERNEKGEVISTDPLLSSSAPFNLEQYKYFEIPAVGPVWVYNVSPKQVKVKNPITDNEKVIYSEASAGDRFGVVFDTYQSSPFWKTFDTLASSAKKLELGFSGFHAGALTEVYMVQNMVEFGPKKAMANFMKYIFADTAKNHELPCFANPEDFQEAASHLVKFGATNDYAAADVQNMFDNMRDAMIKVQKKLKDGNKISGTVAKASMPLTVATQMLSLINKGMDVALWDFLHDGLKLATYRMRADKTKERAKKKGWTEEELSRALDEDGQFVNDMFGGQHWDVLGASHRTLRYAGRVLLSPDWNASTTRHFLALTGFGSIWNEATFENFKQYYKRLKHKELTPEDEGRRSRQISALLCYGIGFMVFYEGIANGINAAFRALDEEKERKKAEEIRKTNPSYKSMYELAYGDEGMKWYDYLMRGNSLGQQSKIFLGRYEDGTEMYVRHGKQFREVPEYLFNHKGELEFPGPMVQRMIGKANPMVRMTLDDINYLSDFQASHADQDIQRKYGKTIGLLYKDALYWAPFLIPSQENKEFKAVDFFFPSSKGFSPWKAQSYFKDFILSGDMEGVVMTYQSCQRNGIDPEAQIKAAIGSVKALESAEMSDGVTSLQEASKRFDAAKSITEKKKMRQKMKKFLSQSDYKAFTQKEALDMVQGYLNGDEDLKEMEKAESKYLMKAKAEDVTEDWRIQNVWNGTMETYQEYQRLKDVDKAKANAFKNSKTNKRLFAARKAISAARRKMNKAKKQMDGTNDAAKLVEIRNTRKELLNTLNGME